MFSPPSTSRWRTALVLTASATAIVSAHEPPRAEVREVLARVGAYVDRYQRELGSVVATEEYRQEFGSERRHLVSDFLLIRAQGRRAGEGEWVGLREVYRVDDVTVSMRPLSAVRFVQQSPDAFGQLAAELVAESARYNLGPLERTVNVPTFGLKIFEAEHRPRFAFRVEQVRASRWGTLWRIAFEERERPTLIRHPRRVRPVPLEGWAEVEEHSGRLHAIELRTDSDGVRSRIVTRFDLDARLGLLVPVEMSERYELERRGSRGQRLSGTATYTDFRRFDVQVRVLPP